MTPWPFIFLALFGCGCSLMDDQHKRRQAETNLVQAEANFLNHCANPKMEGIAPCTWPTVWPYANTKKEGEVSQFSLFSGGTLPIIGPLLGFFWP